MSIDHDPNRSWPLDGHEAPVRFARRVTAEALADWQLEVLTDTAVLVVSELVTNAVRHGRPPRDLTLSLIASAGASGPSDVQIDVFDAGARLPKRRDGGDDGGFGLQVAEALTTLSVHPRSIGKTVRALLPLNGFSPAADARPDNSVPGRIEESR